MSLTAAQLPDDIDTLKKLFLEQQTEYQQQIAHLHEQLRLLIHRRFGATSERVVADQLGLFGELKVEEASDEVATTPTTISEHTRQKPKRRPLPDYLEREEIIHDLPDSEKHCPHDGVALKKIGEVISEQLDVIPAKVHVLRHIRYKYACPCCDQTIKTAPMPPQPIPKSQASPGLLAHIAVSKYADALPLYRQADILQRCDVDLSRATLAYWMVRCGELITPLINLLRDRLLESAVVHCDETRVQVLKEPGKRAQSQSYMWVQVRGDPGHRIILYDYDPSRSAQVPERLFEGFRGYLQTDGYDGYNRITLREGVTGVGCWAHVRRKFDEALKGRSNKHPKGGKATKAIALIGKLYQIERDITALDPADRYARRHERAAPIINEIREWLDASLLSVPPKSLTGEALNYMNKQWPRLTRYLEDGRIAIDNNIAENAIRPFVMGRKNWLFSDSIAGVEASANLYSLVQTAKANNIEPYRYLRHVFTELPKVQSVEQIDALLPWNVVLNKV